MRDTHNLRAREVSLFIFIDPQSGSTLTVLGWEISYVNVLVYLRILPSCSKNFFSAWFRCGAERDRPPLVSSSLRTGWHCGISSGAFTCMPALVRNSYRDTRIATIFISNVGIFNLHPSTHTACLNCMSVWNDILPLSTDCSRRDDSAVRRCPRPAPRSNPSSASKTG